MKNTPGTCCRLCLSVGHLLLHGPLLTPKFQRSLSGHLVLTILAKAVRSIPPSPPACSLSPSDFFKADHLGPLEGTGAELVLHSHSGNLLKYTGHCFATSLLQLGHPCHWGLPGPWLFHQPCFLGLFSFFFQNPLILVHKAFPGQSFSSPDPDSTLPHQLFAAHQPTAVQVLQLLGRIRHRFF